MTGNGKFTVVATIEVETEYANMDGTFDEILNESEAKAREVIEAALSRENARGIYRIGLRSLKATEVEAKVRR